MSQAFDLPIATAGNAQSQRAVDYNRQHPTLKFQRRKERGYRGHLKPRSLLEAVINLCCIPANKQHACRRSKWFDNNNRRAEVS